MNFNMNELGFDGVIATRLSQVFAGVFLTPLENSLFIGDLLAFTLFFPFTFEG
jgi:hypothetical protein